jgi:CRISPR/Cas system-associated exonuclease Cas4 (RecB family)
MTLLPFDFQFTQGNLQDYVDCRRRFQLRYLERLAWPAVETEPFIENERRMHMGAAFHRLAQQHLLGMSADRLSKMLSAGRSAGSDLERWWVNYREHVETIMGPHDSDVRPDGLLVETTLAAPLGRYRLSAKYDAVLWQENQGRVVIVDWKTSQKRPSRKRLESRLQTRVYPYLLVRCGLPAFGQLAPEQIEMVYWFPEFPLQPERFPYDQERYERDGATLEGLVAEIEGLGSDNYHLTQHTERCAFCTYRSLCDRGVRAGSLDDFDEDVAADFGLTLEFDQIAEIEF